MDKLRKELEDKLGARYSWSPKDVEFHKRVAGEIISLIRQHIPEDKGCEHNWIFKNNRRESRNYGSWLVEIYYCSKCLEKKEV